MTRLLTFLLLLILPVAALAQTAAEERDRSFLSDLIEGAISTEGQVVRIDGFRGALSSQANVARLSIADANGEWLVARDLVLDWTRSALFDGRVEVNQLTAGSIDLIRAPEGDPPPTPPEAVPFALPNLPVSINIGTLSAERITLGEALIGQEVTLTLDGTLSLSGGEGTGNIAATRTDGTEGRFAISGGFSNTTRVLALDLDLTEGPGGIAATLLNLPGDPSLELTVEGTAPIDAYDSTLRLASDGEERVTGRFQLGTTTDDAGRSERAIILTLQGDVTPLMAPDYREFFGDDVGLSLTMNTEGDGTLDLAEFAINAQAVRLAGNGRFSPGGWPEHFTLTGDLGLADGTPVRLPISGDPVTVRAMDLALTFDAGAGDAWTGDFTMTDLTGAGYAMPTLTLTGGGTINPPGGEDPGGFTIALAYAATGLRLDDPGLAQALGTEVRGEIRANRHNGGDLHIEALTVEGPGMALAARGTVGAAVEMLPYDLQFDLDAADLGRFATLTGLDLHGAANLAIRAQGEGLNRSFAINLSGHTRDLSLGIEAADALLTGPGELALSVIRDTEGLRIDRFAVMTDALTGSGAVNLTSADSTGTFTLELDDVARVMQGLSGPVSLTGDFSNGPESGLSVSANAALPGATADFTAIQPAGSGVTTLDLTAAIPALAAFAEAAGLDLTGRADLTVSGNLTGGEADLALAARTTDLGIGIAQADMVLAGDGTVDAQIRRDADGVLRLDDLRIVTALLNGNGQAVMDQGRVDSTFDLTLTETAGLVPDVALSGPARLEGQVIRQANGAIRIEGLNAQAMGATADVTGDLVAGLFDGTASLSAADLATLAPLTGQNLGGAVELTATGQVATDLSSLRLVIGGGTRNLDPGVAQIRPLLAGDGPFGGTISRTDSGPFTITGLSYATPALRLLIDGTLDGAAIDADLAVVLPEIGVIAPGLSGTGRIEGNVTRSAAGAITADLTGAAPGATLSLTAASDGDDPMAGIRGRATVSANDLSPWSRLAGMPLAGRIDATVDGHVTPADQSVDLTLAATTRDLNPGNATLARLLAGSGSVNAQVQRRADGSLIARDVAVAFPNITLNGSATGTGADTTARFDARLANVGLFAPDFSGPATATGTATLTGGAWRIDADLTGPGGIGADVAGTIAPGGAMNLTASGTAPLGLANGFIEPRRIGGQAAFDLRLNGPAGLDALAGTVRISGAEISDPGLAMRLTDIGGTVTLAGGRATLDINGAVAGGGRITVGGGLGLTPPMAADLTITAADVLLRDPTLYETTADGTIRITGPLTGGALIAGQINLGPTEIQIPSSGVGGLGDLPAVSHVAPPAAVTQTLARAGLTGEAGTGGTGGTSRPMALDILISAPQQVFIRGRGLDVELGGSLRIGGTTALIQPAGALELIRGRLDILQQRFVLTEGQATLQGDFIPVLRLVAETEARTGTQVAIILDGPATEPTVTFTSSPELPQDEVLAQLLFGRDLTSITAIQAVQLAAAVGTLAGRGGGGIIAGIRTGLGVDDLDIVTDDTGGAALRVGTYLGENLYTDVTVGQAETEVNINLDLTRDLTVTGSVTSAGETSLGIFFERDY